MELLLLAVGVYFSVKSRFFAQKSLRCALRSSVRRQENSAGGFSVFSTLCTNLAATVGTGNIVGVAAAVMAGGPGALFWMLIAAVIGMSTKCAENMLAVRYRTRDASGVFTGGPFLYIQHGLKGKYPYLAAVFAAACLLSGALGMGTVTQSNSIALSWRGYLPTWLVSVIVTAFASLVILGGCKRISAVAEKLIPAMTICYVILCAVILIRNAERIPDAILSVFKNAFSLRAAGAAAGVVGMRRAMAVGLRRGVFSNEAGLGTSAIAAAASGGTELEQGYAGIVSVFIDTVVLCTLTGLCVLVTGTAGETDSAVSASVNTVVEGLPLPAGFSKLLFASFLSVFAFSTVIGWFFYAERCAIWLLRCKKRVTLYRILYLSAVFLGPFLSADFAWLTADVTNLFMAVPNLIALWLLRKEAVQMMQ